MGKIRTRILGLENIEQQQKEEQKKRSDEKKAEKKKATPAQEAAAQAAKNAETEEGTEETKVEKKVQKEEKQEVTKKKTVGKKYKAAQKAIEKDKLYTIEEAVKILKQIKYTKFDESVELHLNVLETGLKGEIELPHSTGKTVKVAIVDDALLDKLENGVIEFDMLVTHPSYMPKLAKFARVLGPKGLMPNPKSGTVSPNPEEVAKKFEKGALRWKTEAKFPLIHQMVAKLSAEDAQIIENAKVFIKAVGNANIKGAFIKSTMSPGIKLDLLKI